MTNKECTDLAKAIRWHNRCAPERMGMKFTEDQLYCLALFCHNRTPGFKAGTWVKAINRKRRASK